MYRKYPLFNSHIDIAHSYWKRLVTPGDVVIDATCGNGNDTLVLAEYSLSATAGTLYAFDFQESAINIARAYLLEKVNKDIFDRIHFQVRCHSTFPESIRPKEVKLIVYNLGYLPGGDKKITTMRGTTLESVEAALGLIKPGGLICITCYPGHGEGETEEADLLVYCKGLDPKIWSCCHHTWVNRRSSPSVLLLQRSL